MATYKVGYFVGSLSSTSINRELSRVLINLAPEDLEFAEIPIGNLPLSSQDYELIVVGDRGLSGFTGLLIGSVAVQLAAHATCPVFVARGSVDPAAHVLLGVDGSPANDPVVGFAFEEAALRCVPLVALHAWRHPVSTGPGDMLPLAYDLAEVEAEEARLLAEALAGWHDKYPDVTVHTG